jgi:hypothetical protein
MIRGSSRRCRRCSMVGTSQTGSTGSPPKAPNWHWRRRSPPSRRRSLHIRLPKQIGNNRSELHRCFIRIPNRPHAPDDTGTISHRPACLHASLSTRLSSAACHTRAYCRLSRQTGCVIKHPADIPKANRRPGRDRTRGMRRNKASRHCNK